VGKVKGKHLTQRTPLTKSAPFRYYRGNKSVFFLTTTRTIREHTVREILWQTIRKATFPV
jgi:hypothetical protein